MKKYVLTGGPGSGKSSILLALEQYKENIVREAAEDWIRLRQASGVQKPWLEPDFQDSILELQIKREADAEKAARERVFIDRGLLDGLAYYQIANKELSDLMKYTARRISQQRPYEKIFLIENMGCCNTNEVRREDQKEALELERLQEQNYRQYGFEVIRIPPGTVEQRMLKILANL